MEPTLKANTHPAYSCKPSSEKRIVCWTKKVILFNARLIALTGLFILSTSYQSHRNELLLLENDLFLPAFAGNMSDFLQRSQVTGRQAAGQINSGTMPLIREF